MLKLKIIFDAPPISDYIIENLFPSVGEIIIEERLDTLSRVFRQSSSQLIVSQYFDNCRRRSSRIVLSHIDISASVAQQFQIR